MSPTERKSTINTTAYRVAVGQCLFSLETIGVDTARLSHLADCLGKSLISPDNSFRHCGTVHAGTVTCSRGKKVD